MNIAKYLLTIKAEDRPGLLHLITGVLNRKLVPIISLTAAPTDIHDIILISVEVESTESDVAQLALKLENIIEVFGVEVTRYEKTLCMRAAYFKMAKSFLESPQAIALSKYDAVILAIYPDTFLLTKYGTDATILKLYNALDGPHLLGFSQTWLLAESGLISHDDIERIIRLAA
jgi:acetolactate synthase small subunit